MQDTEFKGKVKQSPIWTKEKFELLIIGLQIQGFMYAAYHATNTVTVYCKILTG